MKRKRCRELRPLLLVLPMAAVCASSALAGAPDSRARDLAASCAACHGTDGHSTGEMPRLAGRDASELAGRLLEFKGGARSATVMHQHAKGYTEDEIRAIAEYFASRPSSPEK